MKYPKTVPQTQEMVSKMEAWTTDQPPTREQLEKQLTLQHPVRGRMEQEYEIYVAAAEDLGWDVKTYDEWLDS